MPAAPSDAHRPLALGVSPHGRIVIDPAPAEDPTALSAITTNLTAQLEADDARALLELGARHPEEPLPPSLGYFRELARALLAAAAAAPSGADPTPAISFEPQLRAEAAPPMLGREYIDANFISSLWERLASSLREALAQAKESLEIWLNQRHQIWAVVGRVCFHLAENKADPDRPFAFLATYSVGLTAGAKVSHRPLGQALQESSAAKDRASLLRLLVPVNRAAEHSPFVKELVESNAIFRPQAWTAQEAHRFLREVPALGAAGVVVRVPDWWRPASPARVTVQVTLGGKSAPELGAEGLLAFDVGLALDGTPLTDAEREQLRTMSDGLVRLRGRWVEIDRARLDQVLDAWTKAQSDASDGVPFHEAMRLLAGVERPPGAVESESPERSWSRVLPGPWLANLLGKLRAPGVDMTTLPAIPLQATLRPYQEEGVRWLSFLNQLGLGACLADDMGLGKTIQVLALLLLLKQTSPMMHTHLLVAPASLLENWRAEAARFAPSLQVRIAHSSGDGTESSLADNADLVVTTYGALGKTAWLRERHWDTLVLDEAQAIKNPGARQTRAAKALDARVRLALTGTPVENRAGDLWSLFDFLQPGLLGNAVDFRKLANAANTAEAGWAPVRALVAPYLLRRLKTDRRVAPDLPDKTEQSAECGLTREQASLYQRAVDELRVKLASADGMARRGAVLQSLMRLKQICNHPSHWLGDGGWQAERSGKLQRLAELVQPIAARQEKALVFSQFREAVEPLANALAQEFGKPGLVLHGETAIGKRKSIVDEFQSNDAVPFLVLSLKAGGTGLNLTAATHVIHFDRWWNPAVEDQATDRAFRIGQKKAVFVHKLVCRGTVEERVDEMIRSKRKLAKELLAGEGEEVRLTELSDEELLQTVSLDLARSQIAA